MPLSRRETRCPSAIALLSFFATLLVLQLQSSKVERKAGRLPKRGFLVGGGEIAGAAELDNKVSRCLFENSWFLA